jgi:hypothetical protein
VAAAICTALETNIRTVKTLMMIEGAALSGLSYKPSLLSALASPPALVTHFLVSSSAAASFAHLISWRLGASQKTGYPAGGRGPSQKRPAGHLPSLRRRVVLRARRLGSFVVNHDAIVDLSHLSGNTRAYWASGPTFLLILLFAVNRS